MYPSEGLKIALNEIRETSIDNNTLYHKVVSEVRDDSNIGEWGAPILDSANTNVLNEFVGLLKKVVFTAVYNKTFNNPLAMLEGERMPLGQFIEDVYINPAKAHEFKTSDFSAILQRYEVESGVQYLTINSDKQWAVSVTREKIRNAFTSWNALEGLITGYINSLYNGCYLQRYNDTKALITGSFVGNRVQYEKIADVTDKQSAQALVQKMRATFTKMQVPNTKYNAWNKVKGGRMALKTWSDPEDIVVIISADIEALVDVQVLATALNANADKTDFLGRVIVVDDFNQYNDDGTIAVDGSAIKAMIADKSWFKIKTQDFAMDEFYNAGNRVWNYFLNDVRMVNMSYFGQACIFATADPVVDATDVDVESATATVKAGEKVKVGFELTPPNATSTVSVASSAESYATAEIVGKDIEITGVAEGSATITVTANSHTATIAVTVEAGA